MKRQIEDLRDQLNDKDLELKNYHRTITDLEQKLNETQNVKILFEL
jgi:chromosome segregation ATPase